MHCGLNSFCEGAEFATGDGKNPAITSKPEPVGIILKDLRDCVVRQPVPGCICCPFLIAEFGQTATCGADPNGPERIANNTPYVIAPDVLSFAHARSDHVFIKRQPIPFGAYPKRAFRVGGERSDRSTIGEVGYL